MKNIVLLIALIFIFSKTAFAEVSIKAEVDKTVLTTDDLLNYKLTVSSQERSMLTPKLAEFSGLSIVSHGHSSNISFTKTGIKTVVVYSFVLSCPKAGEYKIKPASIEVRGKNYFSEEFLVIVKEGQNQPEKLPEEIPFLSEEEPGKESPRITL
ncbi:MAG: hypothetical protein DRP74_03960 [Candidatus Omnitrophota bacterium]|nr:MAG: hypothetical protein DRP74_03960 [Candidatus Omnitrophota bacterium]